MHYCTAVRSAMRGNSIRLYTATSGCPGGSRALGLTAPTDDFYSGARGRSMGLYKDESTAAAVACSMPPAATEVFGLVIKPMELFERDPDVVIVSADPRTVMRIVQGYTWSYGQPEGMFMTGNQAVCVECTMIPLETGSINVSSLCSGTRYTTGWKDTDLMAGIPFSRFYGTVEGIEGTVNAVEPDHRKREIEACLSETGLLNIEVEYGSTYYKKSR